MLFSLKLRIEWQIVVLAVLGGLAFILGNYLNVHPRLGFSLDMFARGIAAGILGTAGVILLAILGLRLMPGQFGISLSQIVRKTEHLSVYAVLGAAVTAGAGEELLFRAIIFTYLLRQSPLVAFSLNALIALLLYFRGTSNISWAVLKAVESCWYAALFQHTRSLWMVALAHAVVEATTLFFLRANAVARYAELSRSKPSSLWDLVRRIFARQSGASRMPTHQ